MCNFSNSAPILTQAPKKIIKYIIYDTIEEPMDCRDYYKGKKILITGGTGFIGSNLAFALTLLKTHITLLSTSTHRTEQISDIVESAKNNGSTLEIIMGDLRDAPLMQDIVKDKDIIFNLAAKVSHMDKGVVSYEDLDVNVKGQLNLLEACRIENPKVKIVFSSTRMVYGENTVNPIIESHPTNPTTLYGIHKLTVEKYHLAYAKRYGLRPIILRIGNPYGDRQHYSTGLYSLPGWFMNRAMNGETIEILSDGKQERDYIYIGDLVEIMLRVGATDSTVGKIYNAGSGISTTFGEMVEAIGTTVTSGKFVYVANPVSAKNDSYSLDTTLLEKDIKWKTETPLKTGLEKMHDYAKAHPIKP